MTISVRPGSLRQAMLTQETAKRGTPPVVSSSLTPNLMVTSHTLVNGKREKASLCGIHYGLWQFLTCRMVPRVFYVPEA